MSPGRRPRNGMGGPQAIQAPATNNVTPTIIKILARGYSLGSVFPASSDHRIQTPRPSAIRCKEEKNKTQENSGFPVVLNWPRSLRLMKLKVRHGHLT